MFCDVCVRDVPIGWTTSVGGLACVECAPTYFANEPQTIPAPAIAMTERANALENELAYLKADADSSRYREIELEAEVDRLISENEQLRARNLLLADQCQTLHDQVRAAARKR